MSITKLIYTRWGYLIWKCWRRNSFLKIFISGLYDDSRNGNYTVPLRSNPFSLRKSFEWGAGKKKCWRMLNKGKMADTEIEGKEKGFLSSSSHQISTSQFSFVNVTPTVNCHWLYEHEDQTLLHLFYISLIKKNVHCSLLFVLHISDSINPSGPIWVLGLISVQGKIEGLEQHRCIQNLAGVHGKGWQ